jgi:hypothetical protein
MQAAIPIAGSLIGGYFQNKASKDATKAQTSAANQAIGQNQAMFQQVRGDLQPYMQGGQAGLANLLGGNYTESPGYQYMKSEGLGAVDASAAARGQLNSGGHSLDLMRHAEGMAAQDYGNWWNQQMGLAQLGQNSAAGVGAMGMNSANTIGGYLGAAGQAQANGAISQGNNIANTVGQLGAGLGGLLGGQSSYGGGQQASNFGLPSPVSPYANASYGTSGSWFS